MFRIFENGKIWQVLDNYVEAIVDVALSDVIDHNHDGFLDIIAEEAVGNILLMDISYEVIGVIDAYTIRLKVTGDISDVVDVTEPRVVEGGGISVLYDALAVRFGWRADVRAHVMATNGILHEHECIIPLSNGRELRCPAHPLPCSYVRIAEAGHELMYWASDEWRDNPQDVIGAILGLAKGIERVEGVAA